MKFKNFKEMYEPMKEEINKSIPENRFMSQDYDIWLNEQNEIYQNNLKSYEKFHNKGIYKYSRDGNNNDEDIKYLLDKLEEDED